MDHDNIIAGEIREFCLQNGRVLFLESLSLALKHIRLTLSAIHDDIFGSPYPEILHITYAKILINVDSLIINEICACATIAHANHLVPAR